MDGTRELLSRRALLASGAVAAAYLLTGCQGGRLVQADIGRQPPQPGSTAGTVAAVAAFSRDLAAALAGEENLVCSPYSVLTALAMVRLGATGETASEMDDTLHLPDQPELNSGLNTLEQTLSSRAGRRQTADGEKATVVLDVANQVWAQAGMAWQPMFLQSLATSYGTGVRELEFAADPDRARKRINAWAADRTHDRIQELLPPGTVHGMTRMALVNAIYIRAPWHVPLTPAGNQAFRSPRGPVDAPMLTTTVAVGGQSGRSWQAVRLPLAGRQLALTVVLPETSPAELLATLTGPALVELLRAPALRGASLTMPAFSFRSRLSLPEVLIGLGMERAFRDDAEFSGMTATDQLKLDAVEHQGWIAVDEDGLEAAAATAATMTEVSAPAPPELQVVLDRPFLFCVHDLELGLPLLLGIVQDPLDPGR